MEVISRVERGSGLFRQILDLVVCVYCCYINKNILMYTQLLSLGSYITCSHVLQHNHIIASFFLTPDNLSIVCALTQQSCVTRNENVLLELFLKTISLT